MNITFSMDEYLFVVVVHFDPLCVRCSVSTRVVSVQYCHMHTHAVFRYNVLCL
jgi:hypothetical protein